MNVAIAISSTVTVFIIGNAAIMMMTTKKARCSLEFPSDMIVSTSKRVDNPIREPIFNTVDASNNITSFRR